MTIFRWSKLCLQGSNCIFKGHVKSINTVSQALSSVLKYVSTKKNMFHVHCLGSSVSCISMSRMFLQLTFVPDDPSSLLSSWIFWGHYAHTLSICCLHALIQIIDKKSHNSKNCRYTKLGGFYWEQSCMTIPWITVKLVETHLKQFAHPCLTYCCHMFSIFNKMSSIRRGGLVS